MFKILLLGKFGQLGWELLRSLAPLGQVTAVDFPEIDLVHGEQLPVLVRDCQPQVIINATAYTAVDRAESEPELAMAINAARRLSTFPPITCLTGKKAARMSRPTRPIP